MQILTTSKILIIGSGRLAQHLSHWCRLLLDHSSSSAETKQHFTFQMWARKTNSAKDLEPLIKSATHIWLAISDQAIEKFYIESVLPNLTQSQLVIHFSGALHLNQVPSIHPLMTFGDQKYTLETYRKIQWALFDNKKLSHYAPPFENDFFPVPAESKALYHALCVIAGNFPQILWTLSKPAFTNMNVPQAAIENYILQATLNYIEQDNQALTGPLVRKDKVTIEKNISALQHCSPPLANIYKTIASEFLK